MVKSIGRREQVGRGLSASVRVDGEEWVRTPSLRAAGPTDRVFALHDGRIVFGDGTHGAVPPAGASVTVSYNLGAGSSGDGRLDMTIEWPPPSGYRVRIDPQGVALSIASDEVERFAGATRPRFFSGRLLTADDLAAEQQHSIEKRRLHNRRLHGWGIVSGLRLTASTGNRLTVEPGMALDALGREITLSDPVTLSMSAARSPQFVTLMYRERCTDPAPGTDGDHHTRIEEGAAIALADQPESDGAVVLGRLVRRAARWKVDGTFRRRTLRR